METSPTFNLLDLPDAALSIIIASLSDWDKNMIMAACSKTFDMTMLNAEITVKVTKDSKFAGFNKALELISPANVHLQIICPTGVAETIYADRNVPLNTVVALVGMVPDSTLTQLAASCQGKAWERITKVTIKGTYSRCLVPHVIALTCPQLKQLKIEKPLHARKEVTMFHMPLTRCTNLRHLEFRNLFLYLPARYHSPAQLRQNLPNIDTLVFACTYNDSLIEAFASQLTRLELHGEYTSQQILYLRISLQQLGVPEPDNTSRLKVLKLGYKVTDTDMQLLLQLPSLTELQLPCLRKIKQNWSHHACSWQTLHLETLQFTKLANLNLSSLKKLKVGPDAVIHLPDPSKPNSLWAVQRAAASLANIGQITLNENTLKAGIFFGESGVVCWKVHGKSWNHDQTAADLLCAAAQRVGPCRVCNCQDLVDLTLTLKAVISWGQAFIESVCLGKEHILRPQIWQALQQLEKLNTVVF